MAMIRCSECRKDMSNTAAACPHCGAPLAVAARAGQSSSTTTVLKWVGVIVLIVVALRMCGAALDSTPSAPGAAATATSTPEHKEAPAAPDPALLKQWSTVMGDASAPAIRREGYAKSIIATFPDSPEAAKARDALPKLTALVEDEKTNGPWVYDAREDAMTGKRVMQAMIRSENTIDLDFPYQGAQHGSLLLRKHPKWGNDVILSIEKGQILCHSDDCDISVRFDDEQPVTYSGNEPADNSSEVVFLPYAMAKRMERAKRVRIQLTLFNNGTHVLEFNVKGFDAAKLKG